MRGREKEGKKKRGCEKMMRGREKGGAAAAECYFRSRVFSIYTCFFLSVGRVEPVWFNRFQTLKTETESNQNFFVIF
jgi:hypothetical protein